MEEMQKFYEGIAETLDEIPNEKFALWYLLRHYVEELREEKANICDDTPIARHILNEQISVIDLTIDLLGMELF